MWGDHFREDISNICIFFLNLMQEHLKTFEYCENVKICNLIQKVKCLLRCIDCNMWHHEIKYLKYKIQYFLRYIIIFWTNVESAVFSMIAVMCTEREWEIHGVNIEWIVIYSNSKCNITIFWDFFLARQCPAPPLSDPPGPQLFTTFYTLVLNTWLMEQSQTSEKGTSLLSPQSSSHRAPAEDLTSLKNVFSFVLNCWMVLLGS